jgi:NAD(P)-dependent dehydrogenase (short-subunit alcohol dehydrogenase family)
MIRGVQRDLGRLDILVNNVGIQHVAPVHEFPDDKCGPSPGACDPALATQLGLAQQRQRLQPWLPDNFGEVLLPARLHAAALRRSCL